MGELSLFSSENCADLEARNAAGGDDASPRRAGSEKVRQGDSKSQQFCRAEAREYLRREEVARDSGIGPFEALWHCREPRDGRELE